MVPKRDSEPGSKPFSKSPHPVETYEVSRINDVLVFHTPPNGDSLVLPEPSAYCLPSGWANPLFPQARTPEASGSWAVFFGAPHIYLGSEMSQGQANARVEKYNNLVKTLLSRADETLVEDYCLLCGEPLGCHSVDDKQPCCPNREDTIRSSRGGILVPPYLDTLFVPMGMKYLYHSLNTTVQRLMSQIDPRGGVTVSLEDYEGRKAGLRLGAWAGVNRPVIGHLQREPSDAAFSVQITSLEKRLAAMTEERDQFSRLYRTAREKLVATTGEKMGTTEGSYPSF